MGEERERENEKKKSPFCSHLSVAVTEPLHMQGENQTHTNTHAHTAEKEIQTVHTRVSASSLQIEE